MIHTDGTPTIAHRSARVDRLPDVLITREGSLFLVAGASTKGREWLLYNVDDDEVQSWGKHIVVEHRYISDLFDGMVDAGLVVR
jgi:hypothetical protein